ncbi:tetratricopeptide repeat protein [Streptomyces tanashiensis]|uniref:tetratricopeptide repeat protein n=1 Tax=Streptomyces tanashiensis TaxID=67367 RepID=UPI0036AEC54C
MWTAVARAATWRVRGDLDQAAAAFESALLLDSANGSLCLDLADVRAEQGDFAAAASLVERGSGSHPARGEHPVPVRGAFRSLVTGSTGHCLEYVPALVNRGTARQAPARAGGPRLRARSAFGRRAPTARRNSSPRRDPHASGG